MAAYQYKENQLEMPLKYFSHINHSHLSAGNKANMITHECSVVN